VSQKIVVLDGRCERAISPGENGMQESTRAQIRWIVKVKLVARRVTTRTTSLDGDRPRSGCVLLEFNGFRRIIVRFRACGPEHYHRQYKIESTHSPGHRATSLELLISAEDGRFVSPRVHRGNAKAAFEAGRPQVASSPGSGEAGPLLLTLWRPSS
jgi:hypothetical protein